MKKAKALPFLFLLIGTFILIQISLPLLAYKFWEVQNNLDQTALISPQNNLDKKVLGISIEKREDFPAFVSNSKREGGIPFETFLLSVPSLGVTDAIVYVDSNDLSKGLAHLPGSALPGEKGNVFISGHSALPIFSKGSANYGAIFANLEKLKKDDLIKIKIGSGEFNYRVAGLSVVDSNDLSVIPPPDTTGRYISLMTCVPPGFNTKRLVVLGRLE